MPETVASIAGDVIQRTQGTSQQVSSSREGEQSTCQTLLTSHVSYGDDGNTILSTDSEYLNQIYSELLDKGLCNEDSIGGFGSSPNALNVFNPSSRIFAAYHGELLADHVYRTHKHKPPNGFGHWQFEGAERKKYLKFVDIMSKGEDEEQMNLAESSN